MDFKKVSLLVGILVLGTCVFGQENRKQSNQLFFQPSIFYSSNEEPSASGTGFLISGPGGKLFAVTSSHFFDFSVSIEKVEWLDLKTGKSIANFSGTFGDPGKDGVTSPTLELGTDYMVFPLGDQEEPNCLALSLDGRPMVDENDSLWFPYRDSDAANGWRKIGAEIHFVQSGVVAVFLKEKVNLQARSGSPLLTTEGNRVVGLMYGSTELKTGEEAVLFAPVGKLVEQLKTATSTVLFKNYSVQVTANSGGGGSLAGSVWEGKTPFGNDVAIKFTETEMHWDSQKDWSDEFEWTADPNVMTTNWPELNNVEVIFTFNEERTTCVAKIGVATKPMELTRTQ